jgi:hypothetical protein
MLTSRNEHIIGEIGTNILNARHSKTKQQLA